MIVALDKFSTNRLKVYLAAAVGAIYQVGEDYEYHPLYV